MALETVTVKDVGEPNSYGYREIFLEDGRKASTKDEDIAKAAFAKRGEPVEAFITTSKKGNFTNTYLNMIDGVGSTKPPARSGRSSSSTNGGGRTPAENKAIAQQWAIGRAVELLAASGAEFDFPLDTVVEQAILSTAQKLLDLRTQLT